MNSERQVNALFLEILNEYGDQPKSQSEIETICRAKVDEHFQRFKIKVEAEIADIMDLTDQCDNFANEDLAGVIKDVKVNDVVTLDQLFLINIIELYLQTIYRFEYTDDVPSLEFVCVHTNNGSAKIDLNSRPRFYWDFKPSIPGCTDDMFMLRVSLYRDTGNFGISLNNVGKYYMIQQKYPKSQYKRKQPSVKQECSNETNIVKKQRMN